MFTATPPGSLQPALSNWLHVFFAQEARVTLIAEFLGIQACWLPAVSGAQILLRPCTAASSKSLFTYERLLLLGDDVAILY